MRTIKHRNWMKKEWKDIGTWRNKNYTKSEWNKKLNVIGNVDRMEWEPNDMRTDWNENRIK